MKKSPFSKITFLLVPISGCLKIMGYKIIVSPIAEKNLQDAIEY